MGHKIDRRTLLLGGTAAGLAAATPATTSAGPAIRIGRSVKPIVVSSANGHHFKNGGDKTCVETAFAQMIQGIDVLDALIAGANIVELDPTEESVGYGGLPNADGIVQLDASCMHGPLKRAGAVAALEGVRTPSSVARAVMDNTDHHLIVGKDAQRFARSMGFTIEDDLNTEHSRKMWLEWKRRTDPIHYLDPKQRSEAGYRTALLMAQEGLIDTMHLFGTLNCTAINARGEICGLTTTSGLAFKIPGRVGDSPILGAGLYVDGSVGAAGSTGRGEANLYNLCSFLIVEEMRHGRSPKDAGMEALRRIQHNTIEKRLLNERGEPNFNIQFYILDAQGRHAGVTLNGAASYAVCDESGPRTVPCESLLH